MMYHVIKKMNFYKGKCCRGAKSRLLPPQIHLKGTAEIKLFSLMKFPQVLKLSCVLVC